AGREHERRDLFPINVVKVPDLESFRFRGVASRLLIVEGDDLRAARFQRGTGRDSRTAKAEHRDFFSGKDADRGHRVLVCLYRNFSEESPISASTIEMIQNRITTCASVQPFCSK